MKKTACISIFAACLAQVTNIPTFSWDNQGGSTAESAPGAERIICGADTGQIHVRYVTAPNAPYTLTARIRLNFIGQTVLNYGGLLFRVSSDGKMRALTLGKGATDYAPFASITRWTDYDTVDGDDYTDSTFHNWWPLVAFGNDIWLRIRDDNTNLSFWYSKDGGNNFDQLYINIARTDAFMTSAPNQIGYFCGSNSKVPKISILNWIVTSP